MCNQRPEYVSGFFPIQLDDQLDQEVLHFFNFLVNPLAPSRSYMYMTLTFLRYNNILLLDSTHRVSRVDLPLFLIAMRTNVRYVVSVGRRRRRRRRQMFF